jgi:hypothetical protein
MFSPVKAITAGAVIFAIGGAFLIAQPFDQQANVPGAEAPTDSTPAVFTGRLAGSCLVQSAPTEQIDGISKQRGEVYGCFRWETTDPRISGQSTVVWNFDTLPATEEAPGGKVGTARERITTETGAWEGTLTHLDIDGMPKLESGWYVGEGAHDGLVFYVTLQDNGQSLWGYVSSEPPPVPEAVPGQ